jgi:dynein heavy chain
LIIKAAGMYKLPFDFKGLTEKYLTLVISVQASELIIYTTESVCQSFFLKMSLEAKIPILFIGPIGTGKSAVVLNYLRTLPREKFLLNVVNFSARTSANQTQEIIMSKLDRYFFLLAS